MILDFQRYVDALLEKKEEDQRNYIADGRCKNLEEYRARCSAAKAVEECRGLLKKAVPTFINEDHEANT